jgi:hypothetical protein
MSEFSKELFQPDELPMIAKGVIVRSSEIENMQSAAAIVNNQAGRPLFEVEILPPDENTTTTGEDYVRIRLTGEWLQGRIRDASQFWEVKRDLDAGFLQDE